MRKIALVTTSRADYGIQSRLIRMLQDDEEIAFSLIVSGSHLSEKHGMSVHEIENDGIAIAERIDLGIDADGSSAARVLSRGIIAFCDVLTRLQPDICILLGDRYEMFAAAVSCVLVGVAVAHLHGGETTEGANDEVFRHSITKAAFLHFTSCEAYWRRVIQMGEAAERVYNVGSLGVENIGQMNLLEKAALARELGVEFSEQNLLVAFHPVTFERGTALRQVDELLAALDGFPAATLVFTHPNADDEGDAIADRIRAYAKRRNKVYLFKSLGARRYLSMLRIVDALVGNSSSGIIEAPSLKTPTVNVGDRQKGRIQARSIVNCPVEREAIKVAVKTVLAPAFKAVLAETVNPYAKPDTASTIINILKKPDLDIRLKKKFYDIDFADSMQ